MPRFTVIPKLAPVALTEVDVADPARVLNIVAELECHEADVLCDGNYAFSLQRGGKGMWIVSNRNPWQPPYQA